MKGMNMMYSYRGKVAGMVIAGAGIIALIIQKLTHFTVIQKLNSEQHFNLLLWITIFGLFTMMFSKEKIEDERVQQIRTKSLMYSFMLVAGATLAFAFTVTLMPTMDKEMAQGVSFTADEVIEGGRMLMFYPAIGIVIYLIMFHIGIYFDNTWDYEDEPWSLKGLLKNKRYRIALVIGGIIIIELIFRLIK